MPINALANLSAATAYKKPGTEGPQELHGDREGQRLSHLPQAREEGD